MKLTTEACLARISHLPHADVIDPERARRWVGLTQKIDPERIGWHIARAAGIGGSETGTLLSWRFPEDGNHSRGTAERMCRQKLLMLPPDRANDDMARGSYLEDFIQGIYERKLERRGVSWRRRDDIKAAVEAGPHPKYPWLRASLDGVYEIDGGVYITDFKAPSTAMLDEYVANRNFDDYRAQLNHYALVADGHGITIDGMELAMFDYRRVASNGCEVFPIEIDPVLQQKIIIASSDFWHGHVITGTGIEPERERVLTANAGVPPAIEERARAAVIRKISLDKLTKEYDADQAAVEAWVKKTGIIGDAMLPLGRFSDNRVVEGFLQVRAKSVMDGDRAAKRLSDLGMSDADIDDLRGPATYDSKKLRVAYDQMSRLMARVSAVAEEGGDVTEFLVGVDKILKLAPIKDQGIFDDAKLTIALESFGELAYTFLTEKLSSGLPRGNSQDKTELLARIGGHVDEMVGMLVSCEQVTEALPEGANFIP